MSSSPSGSPHSETTRDYIEHIMAEEKRRDRNGIYEWVQVKPTNHLLDCTVIAFALADTEALGGIKVLRMQQNAGDRRVLSKGVER